jgi:4'-phosphopantetheinyl transferase
MLMSIFWLQQTIADVPPDNAWLCANEALRLSGMNFAKRRSDWRLGRWAAKCAIAAYMGWPAEASFLDDIEIRAATSGAPEILIAGQLAGPALSLSHCAGRAIAAVASPDLAVGCDLERIEPRIDAFVTDYFTPEEQSLVREAPAFDRPALVSLLWSAKESALKALRQGLRLDTRCISVNVGHSKGISVNVAESSQGARLQGTQHAACDHGQDDWHALQAFYRNGDRMFYGWWQASGDFVRTLVADAPLLLPVLLNSRL